MSSLRPVSGTSREVLELLRPWLAAAEEPEPLIVETSGSTGAAKRVVLSRRALLASASATSARLGEGPWLLALPAAYVAGLQVFVRSLTGGHEPVLLEEHGSLAEAVVSSTSKEPMFTSLVPTQLHRYLESPADTAALRTLETVLLGGGPIDPVLRARAEEAGLRIVATYGSSETSGGCVYDGYPLPGVELDTAEDGRIRIGGPTLFDGYDGDPALTAEVLGDGWFVTSDAGRLDPDGRLTVLGRVDDVVISGGVNVPTQAVAARLREHPAVEQAEVIGVPADEWGHKVVAIVVGSIDLPTARDWVSAVHPRAWAPYEVFVTEELPLLLNGKVDRQRLRRLFGAEA